MRKRQTIFCDICRMYKISQRQHKLAKALNVVLKPSKRLNKKIGIYTPQGKKLYDIGDLRYLDYSQYLSKYGKAFANERKRLYWLRHKNDVNSGAGFYAARILWL